MRARPNLSGDRLVQDYLTRVAAAARHLPKGARMAFVGRTKAQIEQKVAAAGTDDPGKVAELLAAFGEPEELVRAERLRIDNKWLKKRGREEHPHTPAAARDASSTPTVYQPRTHQPRLHQPRFHRPLNSRWRPATPPPRMPARQTPGAPDGTRTGPPNGTGPGNGAGPAAPPPWPGDLDALMPRRPPEGEDEAGSKPPTPLDRIWQLARGHLLESVAVVVIGLGGALLPFPFWLVGALVAVFSRLWDGWDKVAAFGGPVLVDLLGAIVSAVLMGGKQNVIVIYVHALHVDTGLWIRLGCVLTAVYLAWRVSQGRRLRIPPWQR